MDLTPGTLTVNGEDLPTAQTGTFTWAAADITLTIRPTATWRAMRRGASGDGDTAQQALDALTASERTASRRASRTAQLSPGQLFARTIRTNLHLGPRTRRHRNGLDLHAEIHHLVVEIACEGTDFGHRPTTIDAVQPGYGALLAYDKHIAGGRADVKVRLYVGGLTPWQFLDLLAEMIDAGITNTGMGERWFEDLRPHLSYGQTNPVTGNQPVHRSDPSATH